MLSGVSSFATKDHINATITYNVFLVPVIIVLTILTVLNVAVGPLSVSRALFSSMIFSALVRLVFLIPLSMS